MLAALMLPLTLAVGTVTATAPSAHASVTTVTWPGIPLPYGVNYAQDNGGVAVLNDSCPNSTGATATNIATLDSSYNVTASIPKTTGSWSVYGCAMSYGDSAVGNDGTLYFVEANGANHGTNRIVAMRNGALLWVNEFSECLGNHLFPAVAISDLHLGFDGNLYALVNCAQYHTLTGINPGTGAKRFMTTLPGTPPSFQYPILPYNNGVAVVNNGNNVYFYGYDGSPHSSDTFSPTPPSGATIGSASITADGRVYLFMDKYDPSSPTNMDDYLYYKDAGSSTIHSLALPTGAHYLAGDLYATPGDGVALRYMKGTSSSYTSYLAYFDASGTQVYETAIPNQLAGTQTKLSVDNAGSVILVSTQRVMFSVQKQEVYIDSVDTSGTMTRVFDSNASFGTSGTDVFTTSDWVPESIGDGVLFLTLCHQTNPSGSWATTCSSSNGNPQVVAIPTASQYSYPRSAMISALSGTMNYVALGDSYASGEGNPPFIAPTDNNGGDGCDRSASSAYPVILATTTLALRAFVACSNATTADVAAGMNGEPSQLSSLDSNTDIVTITVGGDDVGFADFAEECVIGTCDAGSAQYQTAMEIIDDPLLLEAHLEALFAQIRTAAPNAAVFVVGYPQVVTESGGSCPPLVPGGPAYLSSGERIAVDTVITGLNNKLAAATADAGPGFEFINPTADGSPFEGHDLCSSSPYFLGLNAAEHRFSFHPNPAGQAAYAELVAASI